MEDSGMKVDGGWMAGDGRAGCGVEKMAGSCIWREGGKIWREGERSSKI